MRAVIWLILFIVLLVFEFATMGLTTIWFAAGSLVAFFASLFHATWWLQFVLFIIVSFVMLMFTRPFAMKYINRNTKKTNLDSIIGAGAKVVAEINNEQAAGYVMINGVEWAARSADGKVIPPDVMVTVKAIEGVKVIVEQADAASESGAEAAKEQEN